MYNFLWDGKPDKIKRKTIIKDYKYGGLKMIDINAFIRSLKGSWIKRIYDDTNKGMWKYIYKNKLYKYGQKMFFESNITKYDILKLFPDKGFFQDILLAWQEIKGNNEKNNISQEIIWNNSNLKSNGNTFYNKKWVNRGISLIEQLYDFRNKRFFNFNEFKDLYQIDENNFLLYTSIIHSIPNRWKNKLKTEQINPEREKSLLQNILKATQVNKYMYNHQLLNQQTLDIKSEKKWEEEFGNINWKKVYMVPIFSSIDTKLRNFQFKFLHRIIPTNKSLFKYKLVNSNICDICNMNIDSIKHLFWECPHVQHFWSELKNYLNDIKYRY